MKPEKDYLNLFLQSREAMGASSKTLRFYRQRIFQFAARVDYMPLLEPSRRFTAGLMLNMELVTL
jgi:hypothetical protein